MTNLLPSLIKLKRFILIFLLPMTVLAQSVNVDSRLLNDQFIDFENVVFTPDGQNVLFIARETVNSSSQLYRQSLNGGSAVVLNPSLVSGGSVVEFKLTPDGQQIVYRADQLVDNRTELFRVPVNGGLSVALDPNFPNNRDASIFNIAPDGQTVVYYNFSSRTLFSVGLTNGNVVNLSNNLPSGFTPLILNDQDFQIDANSERVVFITRNSSFRRNGLFSVSLTGESLTQITAPITGNTAINEIFFITSDGLHVVYPVAIQNNAIQLLRVVIDGSQSPVALTEQVSSLDGFFDMILSPDDAFILTSSRLMSDNDAREILKIPVFADQAIERLSQTFNTGLAGTNDPLVSPDGRFVVYVADTGVGIQQTLFQVPIDGGTPLQLSQPSSNSDDEGVLGFLMAITPDSQHVVYIEDTQDEEFNDFLQLFASPITGGERLVLSERLLDPDEDDLLFSISPDSQQLIYSSLDFNSLFLTSLTAQDPLCFVSRLKMARQ